MKKYSRSKEYFFKHSGLRLIAGQVWNVRRKSNSQVHLAGPAV